MPGVGFEPTMLLGAAPFKGAGCASSPTRATVGYTAAMAKLLFIPVSIGGGLVAGFVSKKVFDQVWGLIDDEEPPDSKHRDIDWRKLLIAAAVQGAIFRTVKEASDHYSRRAFARTTGTWPGQEHPDQD
jgi:Protein of unknown function (DUF4235)